MNRQTNNETSHPAQVDILNFGHFDFDIVSDFDISISHFRLPHNSLPNMMIQSKTNNHLSIINNHLAMATQAQNLSRQMILRAYKALILPAYKAALHLPALSIAEVSRSLYLCRENSTNRLLFMQNKPNFLRGQIQCNLLCRKGLREQTTPSDNEKRTQNEPKTNPISEKPKMSLNFYSTKDYDNKPPRAPQKNEPKTNPKRTQFHTLSNAEGPSPKVATSPNYPPPAIRNLALSEAALSIVEWVEGTKYDIPHTNYAIPDTKYDIRNLALSDLW